MSRAGRYRLLAHTADIGLEVTAASAEELFVIAARGLRSMLFGVTKAEPAIRLEVRLEGEGWAELLVAWLNEILCLCEMSRLVPAEFEIIGLGERQLHAVVTGEPYDASCHTVERTAKAATYHQLVVEARDGGWYARVYIDL